MASENPNVPKKVTVLLEVTVEPAKGNDSDFWDLSASPSLVAAEVAAQMFAVEDHTIKYVRVIDHTCTLKSVRG